MSMSPFDTLVQALQVRYDAGEARSLARIIFEDVFATKQFHTRTLSSAEQDQLAQIRRRLLAGEPLQYILGKADFWGLKFTVSPAVLIPRQETEELMAWALDWLRDHALPMAEVLDIGTGSGCIAVTLAKNRPEARVSALDISQDALEIARENAVALGAQLRIMQADILNPAAWPEGRFDLIISNPPYIPREEIVHMPEQVVGYEPALALFTTGDPLEFYAAIADFGKNALAPGGIILLEINEFRAGAVRDLLIQKGYGGVEIRRDLSGAERMAAAWQPGR